MDFLKDIQKQKIEIFKSSLLEINKKINLLSRKNPEKQIELLLKNSLWAGEKLQKFFKAQSPKSPPLKVLDIGSGNGFPGLLFALLFPQQRFYLCERIQKKAQALKGMAYRMQLPHVEVLCESAKELSPGFDRILSQASMPLDQLLPLTQKLLKIEGLAFLWTSKKDSRTSFPGLEIERLAGEGSQKSLLKLKKSSESPPFLRK